MTEKELFKLCVREFNTVEKVDVGIFDTFDGCYTYFRDRGKTNEDLLEEDYFIVETPHLDITIWKDGGMATLALTVVVYKDRETGVRAYSDILITDIEEEVANY